MFDEIIKLEQVDPLVAANNHYKLHPNGIYTYRVRSGIARTYETTRDAIAYLVSVVGTSIHEIALAYAENEQIMRRRVARL